MKKVALLGAALVVATAGGVTVAMGPPAVRPWLCHQTPERATPKAALDAYYASCWFGPHTVEGPSDGGKESTEYADWSALDEFIVVYRGGKTRFILVGKRSSTSGWRALPPEGSGP